MFDEPTVAMDVSARPTLAIIGALSTFRAGSLILLAVQLRKPRPAV